MTSAWLYHSVTCFFYKMGKVTQPQENDRAPTKPQEPEEDCTAMLVASLAPAGHVHWRSLSRSLWICS